MDKRIYLVTNSDSGVQALVKAGTRAAARSTATRLTYRVEVASQDDLVRLIGSGVKVISDDDDAAPQA